ncbi:hypothetical protein HM1_0236 [Heliomicrobium modesticaldum Ice1]|uniref:Uncharacterized protein n=1 Tax=Heliobacterium modesticaldum (strain ATCC 51547 / Ice1) TaxID=498761 RepID=B0TDZ2_HELMI|nr:hypothetical protein HM1_0236 [Heliomicrobium modesticaldum Ice1]
MFLLCAPIVFGREKKGADRRNQCGGTSRCPRGIERGGNGTAFRLLFP